MTDNDEANFLDHDEIESVSDNFHDWSFEQAMLMRVAIPGEERSLINWNCPESLRTIKILRHMSILHEVSFGTLVQVANSHGFSIARHVFSETIDLMNNLDSAAVENYTEDYFDHLVYKPTIGTNVRRMVAITDHETADVMASIAGSLGTSRSQLAGACILMSLCTSDLMPQNAKSSLQKHIKHFEKGVKTYSSLASTLI
jgi:hypothetical protein